jgi:hypothetical protein
LSAFASLVCVFVPPTALPGSTQMEPTNKIDQSHAPCCLCNKQMIENVLAQLTCFVRRPIRSPGMAQINNGNSDIEAVIAGYDLPMSPDHCPTGSRRDPTAAVIRHGQLIQRGKTYRGCVRVSLPRGPSTSALADYRHLSAQRRGSRPASFSGFDDQQNGQDA